PTVFSLLPAFLTVTIRASGRPADHRFGLSSRWALGDFGNSSRAGTGTARQELPAMHVTCPNPQCAQFADMPDELAGRGLKCPACGTRFRAPARAESGEARAETRIP